MKTRIDHNVSLAKPAFDLRGDDRLAARVLFSTLAHIERIAIEAAKHSNIPGQLEDEHVHYETFRRIADDLGGMLETPRGVQALYDFISELSGPVAVAVHNILGESWIEGIFKFCGQLPLAPDLFASVEADETRHTTLAFAGEKPNPSDAKPYIREMERLICQLVSDYYFIAPLIWFASMRGMGELGEQLSEAHKRACVALGVEHSRYLKDIIKCGSEATEDIEPEVINQSQWERSTWNIGILGPMDIDGEFSIPRSYDYNDLEALVSQAVSFTLFRNPRLNKTLSVARREMYQPKTSLVGIRRLYDREGQIVTIHVQNPHEHSLASIKRAIKGKTYRQLHMPYPEVTDLSLIKRVLPKPRAACIISSNGYFYKDSVPLGGHAPLIELEGASFSIALGAIQKKWIGRSKVKIGILADHHTMTGYDLGLFWHEVKSYLETSGISRNENIEMQCG